MQLFLLGMISMGCAVAALLFLRFWRRTREVLFLAFAASFLLLGITQALLILGALWWQNRRGKGAE